MRRPVTVALAATAAASFLAGPWPTAAWAAPGNCGVDPSSGTFSRQDVDADAKSDLVVGVPLGGSHGKTAGVVDARATRNGTQRLQSTYGTRFDHDRFGAQVRMARLDDDYCLDLAVAEPGALGGRGAVIMLHGSEDGLFVPNVPVLTGVGPGDHLGTALAVSADGVDLFAGVPDRSVNGHLRAGAVNHYRRDGDGKFSLLETITQDTPGVPGVAETGDRFGSVLATSVRGPSTGLTLVVGVPDEAAGSTTAAGLVEVLHFDDATHRLSTATAMGQGAGAPGVAEVGDRFGASLARTPDGLVVVGSPGESVGSARAAGQVQVLDPDHLSSLPGLPATITQDSPGVAGTVEAGDRFGAAVQPFTLFDCPAPVLAIGAPGEDNGSAVDAGIVMTTMVPPRPRQSGVPQYCARAYYQGVGGGLGGASESGDRTGAALGLLAPVENAAESGEPHPSLVVGSPGEDVGALRDAGGITVTDVGATHATSYGDSAGRVAGEQYGQVLLP